MAELDRRSRSVFPARGLAGATLIAVLAGSLTSLVFGVRAATPASDDAQVVAIHRGRIIPAEDVALYHCHDRDYPVIRCFDTEQERDEDATLPIDSTTAARSRARSTGSPAAVESMAILFYVTFYWNATYGGASFTASQPYSDLRDIGWNDAISSFKSLNGQRPKWWEHIGYVAPAWQWAAGAQVSYVGNGANDLFSSIKNVP